MPTRRLRSFDRLPAIDRELIAEWDDIVFRRTEISGGNFRLPAGSDARLAKIYARCQDEKGWVVYASTANTISRSSAYQAIIEGKYSQAVAILERFQTHPRFSSLPKIDQDRQTSLLAGAHFMAGEIDIAVKLWLNLIAAQGKPVIVFHDVSAAIESVGRSKPDEEADSRLLPVIGLLKSKAKKIQSVADGSTRATYRELAALFEAQRIKMWERHQAKLGKPVKHAS